MLRPITVAFVVMLGASAGVAQEYGDCGHPVPDRSIRGCTSLIEQGGAAAGKLGEFHLLRGLAHFLKEETGQAITDLDRAITLTPDGPAPYALRGDVYFKSGQHERAIADYEAVLRLNPNDSAAYYARDMALKELGRPKTPDGPRQPAHLEFHFALALRERRDLIVKNTARFRAEVESEFARLDEAIAQNPKDGAAYLKRAELLLRFGERFVVLEDRIIREDEQSFANFGGRQAERALSDYDQALRVSPTLAEAYLARGEFYRLRGDYERAIADLSEAVRLQPDSGKAHTGRGRAYLKKGDYGAAVADFDEAIRATPKNHELYHRRGLAYARMGERSKAIADFRKALETGLDNNRVYTPFERELARLGVSSEEIRRWQDDYTITRHKEGAAKSPIVISEAFFERCLDRIGKGEYDLATQDCDESLRVYPEGLEVKLAAKARALVQKGELDRAIADLSKAIQLKPNYFDSWFERGEINFKKGEYDQAIADFTEVLRLKPRHGGALIARGEAFGQKQEYARAIADYDESILLEPGRIAPYYLRGFAHEKLGQKDKAIADYRKVLSFDRGVLGDGVRMNKVDEYALSEEGLERLGAKP